MSLWGKIIAGILVLLGTQGLGLALRQEKKSLLYHLYEQKQMLSYAAREISFLHRPMQEIFLLLSERLQNPYSSFVRNIASKMEDGSGRALQEIWGEEVKELENNKCYTKGSFFYLKQMNRCFSCEEDEMQKDVILMLCQEMTDEIERLRKDKEEKDRLIKTLSLLAGILCIVIFL